MGLDEAFTGIATLSVSATFWVIMTGKSVIPLRIVPSLTRSPSCPTAAGKALRHRYAVARRLREGSHVLPLSMDRQRPLRGCRFLYETFDGRALLEAIWC
jgi:hypothetical protein